MAAPSFDLSSISLDLDEPGSKDTGLVLDEKAPELAAPSDPMERKFELAEEFRQIGDVDGARELLQEVVAHASGGLQAKAQSMLDTLS